MCYITYKNICVIDLYQVSLHRYPEYNLFTLKKLIPNKVRCPPL